MHYYDVIGLAHVASDVPLRELEKFESPRDDSRKDVVIRYKPGLRYAPRFDRKVIGKGNPSLTYIEQLGSLGATVSFYGKKRINVEISWILKQSNAVLYVNVVEPLLRMILAEKGYALLHGACLSRKDRAVLVSAPPDTGKTSTVLRCLDEGWFSFMSDDMTIVGPDLTVYTFPKPFTISAHTYNMMVKDDLKDKGFKSKMKLLVKSWVHSKTGRRILRQIGELNVPILTLNAMGQILVHPPKIFVGDLVRNATMQKQAQASSVCLLRTGPDAIISAAPQTALRELLANSDDAFGFPPYSNIFAHMKINGRNTKEILETEKELLTRLVKNTKCFWLYSDSRRWDLELKEIMESVLKPTPALHPEEAMPFEFGPESLLQH